MISLRVKFLLEKKFHWKRRYPEDAGAGYALPNPGGCLSLRIEFLPKTDSGYPKEAKVAISGVANAVSAVKGGPEPLEKESHKFLGSKRDDRFSNPFFEMVPKTCQGSFFVPALE